MEAKAQSSFEVDGQNAELFIQLTSQLSEILQRNGFQVRPYTPGTRHFLNLDFSKQIEVLRNIHFYKDLCVEHESEGYRLKDSASFTWRALQRLGLTPSSDLFTRLREDDIVEIFSSDNVQLFRNFRFFDFCSYSLEELYCVEWFHLYERDETMGPKLISEVMKLLSGERSSGFRPDVSGHIVKEAQSPELLTMDYEITWIDPVYKNKDIAGFVSLEKARLLSN